MKFKENSKNGVAIIIVLGMLALLMMMGVAFSISMRIERRSAGNYSHSVSTKNLIWAGLARAIDDIESEMKKDGGHYYPPFEIKPSYNYAPDVTYVSLGRGDAMKHIPVVLHADAAATRSEWVNFDVTWRQGGNIHTNVPGRYAY